MLVGLSDCVGCDFMGFGTCVIVLIAGVGIGLLDAGGRFDCA